MAHPSSQGQQQTGQKEDAQQSRPKGMGDASR
jgi:hypothetical protein